MDALGTERDGLLPIGRGGRRMTAISLRRASRGKRFRLRMGFALPSPSFSSGPTHILLLLLPGRYR